MNELEILKEEFSKLRDRCIQLEGKVANLEHKMETEIISDYEMAFHKGKINERFE